MGGRTLLADSDGECAATCVRTSVVLDVKRRVTDYHRYGREKEREGGQRRKARGRVRVRTHEMEVDFWGKRKALWSQVMIRFPVSRNRHRISGQHIITTIPRVWRDMDIVGGRELIRPGAVSATIQLS